MGEKRCYNLGVGNSKKKERHILGTPYSQHRRNQENKAILSYTHDATFAWAVPQFGEEARDWAELAKLYMAARALLRGGSYGGHLHALSLFIRRYIVKHRLWDPREILAQKREDELPPIIGEKEVAPFQRTSGGITKVNRIISFFNWAIENDPKGRFGEWEDGHFNAAHGCRCPFTRPDYRGIPRQQESDKLPMPWKIIVDLKDKLAPGLHFSDWKWAQFPERKHGGTQSGDWFEIKDKKIAAMIDLKPGDEGYDPDLVLRRRLVPTYSKYGHQVEKWNPKLKDSEVVRREIVEAWSPIRPLLILTKLEICARTFQVRVLNSGESDVDRVELVDNIVNGRPEPTFIWKENFGRSKLIEGLMPQDQNRVLRNNGVFRSFSSPYSDKTLTGLFFNTNKTGDIGKDAESRGYFVKWEAP
ncbi:MAG TPA: VPA1269 family protein [Opitutaceae bacterium]|jgi:hypothetical protein|nr:VPA1269 family protein [Opitutaceae bacterium]